jgi:hypothetical protein
VSDYENSNDDFDLGKRILRRLSYLDDYVTDEIAKRNQALHDLAIFSPSENPTTYIVKQLNMINGNKLWILRLQLLRVMIHEN